MARTRCTVCGKPAQYKCKYCGDTLCEEHLPPEMHWCMGFEEYKGELEGGRMRKRFNTGIIGVFSHNYSYLLMLLISISFLLQLLVPHYTELLILDPRVVMERPWTLVTHIFLHGGFEHFFVNMLFFVFFGPLLERKIGSTKFLLIFFLAGIFAGIGWCLTSRTPAIGASGALMGIFATLAVLMPRMRVYFFFLIPLEMWMVVVLFALYDFLMIGSGDMIAHTAHLSGLFFGLVAGMWLKSRTQSYFNRLYSY